MDRSYRAKADDSAVKRIQAIKGYLKDEKGAAALSKACDLLRMETEARRRHHPADGIRFAGQLSGLLVGYAVVLRDCIPPAGSSPLAVFQVSFEQVVTGVIPLTGGVHVE